MSTLSLKEVRKKLGLPETPEEKAKKLLKELTLRELKYLAKKHKIKVKGRVSRDWFSETKFWFNLIFQHQPPFFHQGKDNFYKTVNR